MQPTFSTNATRSLGQWLDNYILQKGQAYTNQTTQLYYQYDPRLGTGYASFVAPFRSMVYDSGVSGAFIFNKGSGYLYPTGNNQQAIKTDFIDGRLIIPAGYVDPSAQLSGTYAFRDFNIYFANQLSEKAIFTNKYYLNSRFNRTQNPTPELYDMVAPCIFVSSKSMDNDQLRLGNTYNTTVEFSIVAVAETLYQLENVLSLICDAKNLTFPLLNPADSPLNFYNTYKTSYNYDVLKAQYAGNTPLMITEVSTYKLTDYVKANKSLFFGGADITVQYPRTIR